MDKKRKKRIIFILFIVYCFILAFFLFYPPIHGNLEQRVYNIVPFKNISYMINRLFENAIDPLFVVKNIFVNILIFMPIGFSLPIIFNKLNNFLKITLISFLATLFVETVQLVFIFGIFDVDDIILNTLGGVLGYLLLNTPLFRKIFI